jgi:hypothetical protein
MVAGEGAPLAAAASYDDVGAGAAAVVFDDASVASTLSPTTLRQLAVPARAHSRHASEVGLNAGDASKSGWVPLAPSSVHSQPGGGGGGGGRQSSDALTSREFVVRYAVLCFVGAVSMLMVVQSPTLIEIVGFAATGIEAWLIVPQLLLNRRRRSTEGVSALLLATWIGGDAAKMAYFLVTAQPAPFVVCCAVQLCLDAVLIFQLLTYTSTAAPAAVTAV